MRERFGLTDNYEAPLISFPENPNLVMIDEMPVYEYISPNQFIRQLKELAAKLDLHQFDNIFYNLNGGEFPAHLLAGLKVKGYEKGYTPIEYHMAKDSQPVRVVKRIPEWMKYQKNAVIEDVYDTGLSYLRMNEDSPDLTMFVMSLKVGVPNQVPQPESVIPLFRTVNKWQAGAGMNIGFDKDPFYPKDAFRTFPGVIIRPPDEVLTSLKA